MISKGKAVAAILAAFVFPIISYAIIRRVKRGLVMFGISLALSAATWAVVAGNQDLLAIVVVSFAQIGFAIYIVVDVVRIIKRENKGSAERFQSELKA